MAAADPSTAPLGADDGDRRTLDRALQRLREFKALQVTATEKAAAATTAEVCVTAEGGEGEAYCRADQAAAVGFLEAVQFGLTALGAVICCTVFLLGYSRSSVCFLLLSPVKIHGCLKSPGWFDQPEVLGIAWLSLVVNVFVSLALVVPGLCCNVGTLVRATSPPAGSCNVRRKQGVKTPAVGSSLDDRALAGCMVAQQLVVISIWGIMLALACAVLGHVNGLPLWAQAGLSSSVLAVYAAYSATEFTLYRRTAGKPCEP